MFSLHQKAMNHRQLFLFMVFLFLPLALLLSACGSSANTATEEERPPVVRAAEVKQTTLTETVPLTGTLTGDAQASISYRGQMPLLVEAVLVEMGDTVEAGQVLVRLDARDIQTQVQQAEAALALHRSQLADAQIALEHARSEFERMDQLYREGAIAARDWEQAKVQVDRASVSAQQTLPAQIAQAEAALASARNQLSQAVITAPISGKVASIHVEEGQLAAPGSPVLDIVNLDEVFVTGSLPASQIARLEVGQPARVTLDNGAIEVEGRVAAISPAADTSGLFPVKVQLLNVQQAPRPGTYGKADIEVARHEQSIIIPRDALLAGTGKTRTVYVVEDNVAKEVTIEIGIEAGDEVQVLSGLTAGQFVVLDGKSYLADGMTVELVSEEEGQ